MTGDSDSVTTSCAASDSVGYTAVGITNILVVFFYSLSAALDTVEIIAKNYDINKSF